MKPIKLGNVMKVRNHLEQGIHEKNKNAPSFKTQ